MVCWVPTQKNTTQTKTIEKKHQRENIRKNQHRNTRHRLWRGCHVLQMLQPWQEWHLFAVFIAYLEKDETSKDLTRLEQWNKIWLFRVYRGWNPTQLCGHYNKVTYMYSLCTSDGTRNAWRNCITSRNWNQIWRNIACSIMCPTEVKRRTESYPHVFLYSLHRCVIIIIHMHMYWLLIL